METNQVNNTYSYNKSPNTRTSLNPIISSAIFSLCVAAVLILIGSIIVKESMSYFYSPSLIDILFEEVTIKAFFIIFLISESLLLLQAALLFGTSKFFAKNICNFYDFITVSLNAFRPFIILLGLAIVGAHITPIITIVLLITALVIFLIKLYEGTKNLFSPQNKLIFIVPVSIFLNYGIIIWISINSIQSYIENIFSSFWW